METFCDSGTVVEQPEKAIVEADSRDRQQKIKFLLYMSRGARGVHYLI